MRQKNNDNIINDRAVIIPGFQRTLVAVERTLTAL